MLRPLADAWCRLSEGNLLRAGAVVLQLQSRGLRWWAMMHLRMMMRRRLLARLRRALTQNRDAARGCGATRMPLPPQPADALSWRLTPLLVFLTWFSGCRGGADNSFWQCV